MLLGNHLKNLNIRETLEQFSSIWKDIDSNAKIPQKLSDAAKVMDQSLEMEHYHSINHLINLMQVSHMDQDLASPQKITTKSLEVRTVTAKTLSHRRSLVSVV